MIADNETRREVDRLKEKLARIENIKQLPKDATIEQVIDTINKLTNSLKVKR
jgi:hypothetical protein